MSNRDITRRNIETNINAENAQTSICLFVFRIFAIEFLFGGALECDFETDGGAAQNLHWLDEVADFRGSAVAEGWVGGFGVAYVPIPEMLAGF